jgi:hypothetical protein
MLLDKRMRFTGRDTVFHNGEREGKVGTIVLDANLDRNNNFADGTVCCWQIDGQDGVYITALADLSEYAPS